MILRRLARRLINQDWMAAAIEFGIVVIGIYVAFEVERWRDDREQQANNELFLQLLSTELVGKIAALDAVVSSNKNFVDLQDEAIVWLSGAPSAEQPGDDHCFAVFRSLVLNWSASRLETPQVLSSIEQSAEAQDLKLRQLMIRLSARQTEIEGSYGRFLMQLQNISNQYPDLIIRNDGISGRVDTRAAMRCDFDSMKDNRAFKNRFFGNSGRYQTLQSYREEELALLRQVEARVKELSDSMR